MNDEGASQLLTSIRAQIDKFLNEDKQSNPLQESLNTTISADQSNSLPWKAYAKGNGSWIFRNHSKLSEALALYLQQKGEKATIGKYYYQLRGDNHQFIARFPI